MIPYMMEKKNWKPPTSIPFTPPPVFTNTTPHDLGPESPADPALRSQTICLLGPTQGLTHRSLQPATVGASWGLKGKETWWGSVDSVDLILMSCKLMYVYFFLLTTPIFSDPVWSHDISCVSWSSPWRLVSSPWHLDHGPLGRQRLGHAFRPRNLRVHFPTCDNTTIVSTVHLYVYILKYRWYINIIWLI